MTYLPGAAMSGFMRPEPSTVTGPRLEKPTMFPSSSTAPTEKTESYKASGSFTVLQSGPSLPAETATKMPAARRLFTAGSSAVGSQPSSSGQPHELFNTCAAFVGSPSVNGFPPCGKGDSMNCMQSRYSAGLARLRSRLTQPIHCASGAMPMPPLPRIVPSVCVPWPPSSLGLVVASHGSNQL